MHMNVHAAVGILISMIFSSYLSDFEILFIIGVIVIIDFDFLLSRFAKNHNHRRLPTHTLFFYVIFLVIGIFLRIFGVSIFNFTDLWRYIGLLGICGIIHVSMDSIDWGILLFYPFNQKLIGGILKTPKTTDENKIELRHCYFIKKYYGSNIIKILEVVFGISAFLSIILINIEYFYVILIYLGTLLLHLIQLFRCRKEKDYY
ncbi:MAG: metal-dependent hydrolase [Candidatus Hodarchaeota archaeon]